MKSRSMAPVGAEDPAAFAKPAGVPLAAIELGWASVGPGIAAIAAGGAGAALDSTPMGTAGGATCAEGAGLADTLAGMTGGGRAIGMEDDVSPVGLGPSEAPFDSDRAGAAGRADAAGRAGVAAMGPSGSLAKVGRGPSTGGAEDGIAAGVAAAGAGGSGLAAGL